MTPYNQDNRNQHLEKNVETPFLGILRSLWQLGSENELRNYFDDIKILYKDNHYFVCQLLKPKTER